jgi:hypothetical protein
MYLRQPSRSFTERPTREGDPTAVQIVLQGTAVRAEDLTTFHRSVPRFGSTCTDYTIVFDDGCAVERNDEWSRWTGQHLVLVVHGSAVERGDWIPLMAAPGIDVLTVRLQARKAGEVRWEGGSKPAVITVARVNLQIFADQVDANLEAFGRMLRRSGGGTDTVYVELNRRGAYALLYEALSSKTVRVDRLQRPCRFFHRQTEYVEHERNALVELFSPLASHRHRVVFPPRRSFPKG